jgi:hypothetical protein
LQLDFGPSTHAGWHDLNTADMMLRILLRVPGAKVKVCNYSSTSTVRTSCKYIVLHLGTMGFARQRVFGLDGSVRFSLFGQLVVAVVGDKFSDRFRHSELKVDVVPKRIDDLSAYRRRGKRITVPMVRFRYVHVPLVSS